MSGSYRRGLPKELNPSVNSSLLCGLCLNILNNPMQSLNCGHRFCEECINEKKQGTCLFLCPSCEKEGEKTEINLSEDGQIFIDKGVLRELAKLRVNCIYCHGEMELKAWKDHLLSCKEKPRPCQRGCGIDVRPSDEKNHEKVCPERDVACPQCHEKVKLKRLAEHQKSECSSLFSQCEFCGLRVLHSNLETHTKHFCSVKWSTGCPYGCSKDKIKTDLRTHRKEFVAVHLDRLFAKTVTDNPVELESLLKECGTHLAECLVTMNFQSERIRLLEENLRQATIQMTEQELRLTACAEEIRNTKYTSYDGSLMWRIDGFTEKRVAAISNKCPSIFSPPFFTGPNGYQMCARMYLNGDGQGHNTHLSLFFVLMKGPYDPLLRWPFQQKVTFLLKDQKGRADVVDAFRPEPSGESFRRPTSLMNVASGSPRLLPLTDIDDPSKGYVVDDVMFVKIIVDCSSLL